MWLLKCSANGFLCCRGVIVCHKCCGWLHKRLCLIKLQKTTCAKEFISVLGNVHGVCSLHIITEERRSRNSVMLLSS